MKTKNIQHTVLIRATPKEIYDALMNAKKHAQFTGERASIRAKAGAAFTCYDGYITGLTLELKPGKRILQAWRSRDWPPGHYSIVTFQLAERPGGRTQLRFTQVGVPAGDYARKNQGWRTHYWQPLKRFLEK
jgi:activator of HSP90 ATPase